MKDKTKWLVWSNEHKAWWRADHRGYCFIRASAGRYSFDEACKIVKSANYARDGEPNEAMVLDVPQPELKGKK